eukprot:993656-Amorphochlora_amoeboformis.AAC.1
MERISSLVKEEIVFTCRNGTEERYRAPRERLGRRAGHARRIFDRVRCHWELGAKAEFGQINWNKSQPHAQIAAMRMDANASSGMLGRKRCRPACSPHQLMGAGGQVFRTRNIRLKTSRTLFGDVTNTLSRHRILIAKDDRKSYMPHRNALDCPYVLSLVLQWLDTRALCTLLSCNRRLKEKLDSMKNLWQKIRISDVGIRLSQLNELFMRTSLRQPLLMMSLRDTRIMLDDEIPYEIAPKLLRLKSIRIETCNRASLLLREMLPCSVGLKHLEILDCPSVCVNSISSVISSYSGKIKTLKIAGCGGRPLDQDEARVLVDCCPDIEQVSNQSLNLCRTIESLNCNHPTQ